MAKSVAVRASNPDAPPVIRSTIPEVPLLKREYLTSKMPDRKLIALRSKLVSLFKSGEITDEEQDLMETILRRERGLGKIATEDHYLLNKIEYDRLDDKESKCVVKTDDAPIVHHLKKHMECKFLYDAEYNDGKGRADSIGRYQVYVPKIVPGEFQLSVKTVLKELKGHPTEPSDYPGDKILIHRIVIKPKEFEAWFDIEDDSILSAKPTEAQYVF
jgi:hypothetical protein